MPIPKIQQLGRIFLVFHFYQRIKTQLDMPEWQTHRFLGWDGRVPNWQHSVRHWSCAILALSKTELTQNQVH